MSGGGGYPDNGEARRGVVPTRQGTLARLRVGCSRFADDRRLEGPSLYRPARTAGSHFGGKRLLMRLVATGRCQRPGVEFCTKTKSPLRHRTSVRLSETSMVSGFPPTILLQAESGCGVVADLWTSTLRGDRAPEDYRLNMPTTGGQYGGLLPEICLEFAGGSTGTRATRSLRSRCLAVEPEDEIDPVHGT